jgi:hypothetical protein
LEEEARLSREALEAKRQEQHHAMLEQAKAQQAEWARQQKVYCNPLLPSAMSFLLILFSSLISPVVCPIFDFC